MPSYLRGALVELIPTGLIPIPNVIVFQYNPETMTHTWTQPEPAPPGDNARKPNPLAVQGNPGESFSFTLFLDANDAIADGTAAAPLAQKSGVYSRLAALEMLLFPASATTDSLLGTVTASVSVSAGGAAGGIRAAGGIGGTTKRTVPASVINTVLFVWGPGRIVPVRVTALTVTERLYDGTLNPIAAEAQITLRVLTLDELIADQDALAGVARVAYTYTQDLREALAVANLVNAADSVVGMLPI
ncbi:hypothetical protein FK531_14315 [Rhodococcus spelaei]|uniref:Uncharacterized protein n=1 Tax=Rhodococcus spelaei TaxID=2546320 RepID=A0A541B7K7_9NOCA|nr:hypothetical protein [Rhodococcus spelaei]TQF68278.1 hypothetical protein FK531_14315 [Rhodococcus spelaei]